MTTTTQDIVLTRTIAAPLETVWNAWTDPAVIRQWWGPPGFTCNSATVDFREGGRYVWNMHASAEMGGFDMYTAGTYTAIEPLEFIDFTQSISDAAGIPLDPAILAMPVDFPPEVRSTITFRAVEGGTLITVTEYDWPVGEQRDMSEAGMAGCIDKLEALLG